jgi:hypothetical protein
MLLEKQQIMGNKWAEISKEIPGRTENQVKNRFNSLLKKLREEKTFQTNQKESIDHAIRSIKTTTHVKDESNDVNWVQELILMKKREIIQMQQLGAI